MSLDISLQRLHNQHIAQQSCERPEEVVGWLSAVQSQDYGAAKWAVGQRTKGATDATVEQAFTSGTILRTHVLRPTWHFVLPADICWMLELTAPRVRMALGYNDRKLELDETVFARSNAALAKALQGGKQLTRAELVPILQQANITTDDLRFGHIMMHAELDGIVCSGARRGKQFTYALLDERAPHARILARDEALAELTRRYFTGHGPATLQDYVWWSGLTMTDAKAGIEMVKSHLIREIVNGQTYWLAASLSPVKNAVPTAYLLPNFDEYVVGYTDRAAVFDRAHAEKLGLRENVLFTYTIVIDGQVVGTWKRTLKSNAVIIEIQTFTPLNEAEKQAVSLAIERYANYVGLPDIVV